MTPAVTPPILGRRELIAGAGVAALAAVFAGPGRGALESLPFFGDAAASFDRSSAVAGVGERFRVMEGDAKGVVLQIIEIRDLPYTRAIDIEQQFLVRFAGPAAPALAQDTYRFATGSFGDLPLFITPMTDPGAAPAFYEAIVNRTIPGDADRGGQP